MVPGSRRRALVRRQRSPLSSPDLCTASWHRLSPQRAQVGQFVDYFCGRHGQLREGKGGNGAAGRGRAQSEELAVLLLGPLWVRTAPRLRGGRSHGLKRLGRDEGLEPRGQRRFWDEVLLSKAAKGTQAEAARFEERQSQMAEEPWAENTQVVAIPSRGGKGTQAEDGPRGRRRTWA